MTAGTVVHGSTLSLRIVGTSFSDTTIGLGDGLRPQEIVGQQFLEFFSAPVRAFSGWWTPTFVYAHHSGRRLPCDFAPGISPDQCTEQDVKAGPISHFFSACVQCFLRHLMDTVASTLDGYSRFGDARAGRVFAKVSDSIN